MTSTLWLFAISTAVGTVILVNYYSNLQTLPVVPPLLEEAGWKAVSYLEFSSRWLSKPAQYPKLFQGYETLKSYFCDSVFKTGCLCITL